MKTIALASIITLSACHFDKPKVINQKPLDLSALTEDYKLIFKAMNRARVRFEYLITIQDAHNEMERAINKAMKSALKAGKKGADRGVLGDSWLEQAEKALADPETRLKYLLENQMAFEKQFKTIKGYLQKEIDRARKGQTFGEIPRELERDVESSAWSNVFEKARNNYKVEDDDYVTKYQSQVVEDMLPQQFKDHLKKKEKK